MQADSCGFFMHCEAVSLHFVGEKAGTPRVKGFIILPGEQGYADLFTNPAQGSAMVFLHIAGS